MYAEPPSSPLIISAGKTPEYNVITPVAFIDSIFVFESPILNFVVFHTLSVLPSTNVKEDPVIVEPVIFPDIDKCESPVPGDAVNVNLPVGDPPL